MPRPPPPPPPKISPPARASCVHTMSGRSGRGEDSISSPLDEAVGAWEEAMASTLGSGGAVPSAGLRCARISLREGPASTSRRALYALLDQGVWEWKELSASGEGNMRGSLRPRVSRSHAYLVCGTDTRSCLSHSQKEGEKRRQSGVSATC